VLAGPPGSAPVGGQPHRPGGGVHRLAVLAEEPAVTAGMPRALRRSAPQWYRLGLLPS